MARAGTLPARDVHSSGVLVDAIVVAKPENHVQTYSTAFSQAFANRIRPPAGEIPALPLDARKVIARRCVFELPVNGVANLGIGMPEGVAAIAAEEGLLDHLTPTAKPGVIGGQPASGLDFGAAMNTHAVIPQSNQFDFYDGGGLDLARLGQPVLYVTERCVFQLTSRGLQLIEIAPGVDLQRDILDQMEVQPIVDEVTQMDARIFRSGEMGLRTDLLHLDLPDRIALDPDKGQLFLNFEKMRIRTQVEIDLVRRLVDATCTAYGKPVDVVVNYDGFRIDEAIEPRWAEMVNALTEMHYRNVSRYAGSAFMRMKLGEVFPQARKHIFESSAQAQAFVGAGQIS